MGNKFYIGKNVYVFELSNGQIKIGASFDISRRIKEIENLMNCEVCNYDSTVVLANWRKIELMLHNYFKSFLVEGRYEYFNAPFGDACEKMLEFSNEYGELKERPEYEPWIDSFLYNFLFKF